MGIGYMKYTMSLKAYKHIEALTMGIENATEMGVGIKKIHYPTMDAMATNPLINQPSTRIIVQDSNLYLQEMNMGTDISNYIFFYTEPLIILNVLRRNTLK